VKAVSRTVIVQRQKSTEVSSMVTIALQDFSPLKLRLSLRSELRYDHACIRFGDKRERHVIRANSQSTHASRLTPLPLANMRTPNPINPSEVSLTREIHFFDK
jgi:hypothetical protein